MVGGLRGVGKASLVLCRVPSGTEVVTLVFWALDGESRLRGVG